MKKKYICIVLIVIFPLTVFGGYGWEHYVDPKLNSMQIRINNLVKKYDERIYLLEKKVTELEKIIKENHPTKSDNETHKVR